MSTEDFRYPAQTATELARLLGRTDTTTEGFLADCERCLAAYFRALSGEFSGGLPAAIDEDLRRIEQEAAVLRSSLYSLPGEITALVELHLLATDQQQRMRRDLGTLEEPLEDLAAAIHTLRQKAAADAELSPEALGRRLLKGLGNAWRNHFNLRPVAGDPHFESVLRTVLGPAAERDERIAGWLQQPTLPAMF